MTNHVTSSFYCNTPFYHRRAERKSRTDEIRRKYGEPRNNPVTELVITIVCLYACCNHYVLFLGLENA